MGKYFTSEESEQYSELISSSLNDTTDTVIPHFNVPDNVTEQNFINPNQNNKSVNNNPIKIIEEDKPVEKQQTTVKQTDILEKLTQHSFLMVQMNDRLMKIEKLLLLLTNTDVEVTIQKKDGLTPRELYEASLQDDEVVDYMDINVVRNKLDNMKSETIPSIPLEDYIDNGIKLEEVFPDMPDEAYQAAYKSLNSKHKPNPGSGIVF